MINSNYIYSQFLTLITSATLEMFNIESSITFFGDCINRFEAKQLYLDDFEVFKDDERFQELRYFKLVTEKQIEFLRSVGEENVIPTVALDSEEIKSVTRQLSFQLQNYCTIETLLWGIRKEKEEADFNEYEYEKLTCNTLNCLISRNAETESKVLTEEMFLSFDGDHSRMFEWVRDPSRRFTQVPKNGHFPITDHRINYDFSDLSSYKGEIMPTLEYVFELRSKGLHKSLKEILGDKGSIERYCCDRTGILSLSQSLKFDYKSFLPWLEKAINEQYRNTNKTLNALILGSTSEDKRMYREDILTKFSNVNIQVIPHPEYKPTSKLTPFQCTKTAIVIAVETTKFGSIFIPRYCSDNDLMDILPKDIYKYYASVTPETTPYGRNSNLRQIPELAWCELLKVKVRTQHDFNKILELISYIRT